MIALCGKGDTAGSTSMLWSQDHGDDAAFHLWRLFDSRHVLHLEHEPLELALPEFGVFMFSSAKAHTHLRFIPLLEEPPDLTALHLVIVLLGLGAHPYFFDLDAVLFLLGLTPTFVLLIAEFAVIDDLAHRRIGIRRHLDEVELACGRHRQRLVHRDNTQMFPIRSDHPYLSPADHTVDAQLGHRGFALLRRCYHKGTPFVYRQRTRDAASAPITGVS